MSDQVVPEGWHLEVVIIDDGSPVPAATELSELQFPNNIAVRVIEQQNAGVGAARNRGLDEVSKDATIIAFLDSDDIWPADHVKRAVMALEGGFDFYFTDNVRAGYHSSHCRSPHLPRMSRWIDGLVEPKGIVELSQILAVILCLTEFPCQASTVAYRNTVASNVRFKTDLRSSGEDVLFFTHILSLCSHVAFDAGSAVECGEGVNIYFGNLDWNSPRFLEIKTDQLLTYRELAKGRFLASEAEAVNNGRVFDATVELAFHLVRNAVKHPTRAVDQMYRLWRADKAAALSVAFAMPRAAFNKSHVSELV